MTETGVKKITQQIEKQIDVIKAYYHTDEETIFQESALYKVKSSSLFEERQIQNMIKDSHANIVTVSPEYFVIEKTGFRDETEELREALSSFWLACSLFVREEYQLLKKRWESQRFLIHLNNKIKTKLITMANYFNQLSLRESTRSTCTMSFHGCFRI